VTLFASRFILGMVFVVASIDKIADPLSFSTSIEAYDMVPYPLINIMAIAIPWLELVCGIFLVGGVWMRPSAMILSGLLMLFVVAISTAVLRGLNINCGCFGSGGSEVGWGRVGEDLLLLLPAAHIFWAAKARPAEGGAVSPGVPASAD
jgi:hypothetical protein